MGKMILMTSNYLRSDKYRQPKKYQSLVKNRVTVGNASCIIDELMILID